MISAKIYHRNVPVSPEALNIPSSDILALDYWFSTRLQRDSRAPFVVKK